jgi:hypothetical protein
MANHAGAQLSQYSFYFVMASTAAYLTLSALLRIRRAELRSDGTSAQGWLIALQCAVVGPRVRRSRSRR